MNWPPFISRIDDRGFGNSRGGEPISGMVVHHTASVSDAFEFMAEENSRDSHPTYHIASDGSLGGIVHPSRRPWSTSTEIDRRAVTVEVNNVSGAPTWAVSDAAKSMLSKLIAWHAEQAGATEVVRGTTADKGQFFVAIHSDEWATACPGPDLTASIPTIITTANAILNETNTDTNLLEDDMILIAPTDNGTYGGITVKANEWHLVLGDRVLPLTSSEQAQAAANALGSADREAVVRRMTGRGVAILRYLADLADLADR